MSETEISDLDALKTWLYILAFKDDSVIYWRGYLVCDRLRIENIEGRLVYKIMYPAHAIGDLMLKAYQQKRVTLVQKKVSEFNYDYTAILKKRLTTQEHEDEQKRHKADHFAYR